MTTPSPARIYRPARTATQSGHRGGRHWVLEYDAAPSRRIDPLTGWTSSSDMSGQVRLTFATREDAEAYARREGMAYEVREAFSSPRILKAYADNFRSDRTAPWTH